METIDPNIWNRPPNTPVESKQFPTLKTVIFNTENTMRFEKRLDWITLYLRSTDEY